MKFRVNFTPKQKEIIQRICDIQTESLMSLYNNMDFDQRARGIFILYEVEEKDLEEVIIENLSRIAKVKKDPNSFFEILTTLDRRVINHILINWNNELVKISPEGVRHIWGKIYWAEEIEEQKKETILN